MKIDKLYHLAAGFFIMLFFNSWWLLIVTAVGKEVYDEIDYGGWSWQDIVFTILGGILLRTLK